MRYGLIAAASAGAFVISFQLARGVTSGPSRSPASSTPRAEPRAVSEQAGAATKAMSRNAAPIALPVVRVTRRAPTSYERVVLESPREFFAMKMALQEQLVADKHLAGECFEGEDLVGRMTLEFSWWVESTRAHAIASGLRLVQIRDGIALPAYVIECTEQRLATKYEAVPGRHDQFPSFRGEIPVRLLWYGATAGM